MTKKHQPDQLSEFLEGRVPARLQMRYFTYGIKYQHALKEMPTTQQLALVAAGLAHLPYESQEKLCGDALRLWAHATEAIELQKIFNQTHLDDFTKFEVESKTIPPQDKFPMRRDDFLKLLWPKLDTGERAKIFKEWLRKTLRFEHWEQTGETDYAPSQDEVSAKYAEYAKKSITSAHFVPLRSSVMEWHKKYKQQQISKMRSLAGSKGAKHRKKPY